MRKNVGKDVVIWGAAFEAEKFECLYGTEYNVEFYIDRNANRTFHGKPVYTYDEKKDELKVKKIIIASSEPIYREISSFLISEGFKEFEDFMYVNHINKKLIILYGNCHMAIIGMYLKQQHEISNNYFIRTYFIHSNQKPTNDELKYCDLLISQDIEEKNEFNNIGLNYLKDRVRKSCKVIIVPNLYRINLFWPQVTKRFDNENNLHLGEDKIYEDDFDNLSYTARGPVRWMIGWCDNYIEKCILNGDSVEQISCSIKSQEIFKKDDIINNFNNTINKLKEREKKCSISISDYILDNYKKVDLFYDPGHPTNILFKEKARRILCIMGVENICFDEISERMDSIEIFVYGCVKHALQLEYDKEYIRTYTYNGTLWNRAISLEEYIKQYKLWKY